MPCIPVHTVESAPENGRAELKDLESKFGKVRNIHGGMAHYTATGTARRSSCSPTSRCGR